MFSVDQKGIPAGHMRQFVHSESVRRRFDLLGIQAIRVQKKTYTPLLPDGTEQPEEQGYFVLPVGKREPKFLLQEIVREGPQDPAFAMLPREESRVVKSDSYYSRRPETVTHHIWK